MPRPSLLAFPVFLLASSSHAADPQPPVPQVEISAPSGTEQRRNDTAGRISVTREDIARYGDVNVSSLLKRQPGIAVVNGEIRMRGLGAGYTPILIDGEPAPPGFSVDSLAPSMIERIDVMRNGSAEFSTQAIAGSINIIMRKHVSKAQRELTLAAATARGYLVNPSVALRWADKHEQLAWSLGLEVSRPGFHYDDVETESSTEAERSSRTIGGQHSDKLSLSPRLNWNWGDGNSLAWQAVIDRLDMHNAGCATETQSRGGPSTYPDNCFKVDANTGALRTDLTWTRRIGEGKLVAKAGLNRSDRDSDYLFTGEGNGPTLARRVLAQLSDHTSTISGKYLAPMGSHHSLGLGWDGGHTLRDETRMQRDTSFSGEVLGALDEDYRAVINRMAMFAQDEWAVTPRLQAYLGLRWEGLRTDVAGRTMVGVRNRSGVVSPVAQLLWKLPESDKDQIRLALSRTYKAPATRLLVPRRYTVNNGNSPTNPDVRGNPELRPELAWGLDGGYEKYFGKDGVASVSAYVRRIEGVIVNEVDPVIRPWLSTPSNKGNARAAGMEADTRFSPLPGLDLRANLGYNWSRLDTVPGPDNRLAEQVGVTANVGVDYRPTPAFALGMNLNLQFAGAQRISEAQRAYTAPRRNLDVYGLWKVNAKTTWRLSASDALQQERVTNQYYQTDAGPYQRTIVESNRIMIKLLLEMRI